MERAVTSGGKDPNGDRDCRKVKKSMVITNGAREETGWLCMYDR